MLLDKSESFKNIQWRIYIPEKVFQGFYFHRPSVKKKKKLLFCN